MLLWVDDKEACSNLLKDNPKPLRLVLEHKVARQGHKELVRLVHPSRPRALIRMKMKRSVRKRKPRKKKRLERRKKLRRRKRLRKKRRLRRMKLKRALTLRKAQGLSKKLLRLLPNKRPLRSLLLQPNPPSPPPRPQVSTRTNQSPSNARTGTKRNKTSRRKKQA